MKMMTMMTRGRGVARFGSSRARHAHEAATASARVKREHAGVRVRETTGKERRGKEKTHNFSDEEDADDDDAGMWRNALWAIARAPRAQSRKRERARKARAFARARDSS